MPKGNRVGRVPLTPNEARELDRLLSEIGAVRSTPSFDVLRKLILAAARADGVAEVMVEVTAWGGES